MFTINNNNMVDFFYLFAYSFIIIYYYLLLLLILIYIWLGREGSFEINQERFTKFVISFFI